ncbi:MAG: SprT family zinc-dependent metalloprotease [Rhodothalassiaceae bacterium]
MTGKVLIRRSARARRLTLRIDAARRCAVLTAPERASGKAVAAFLDSHRDWIGNRLAELPQAIALVDGALLPFRGRPHRLRHCENAPRRPELGDGEIRLGGPPGHVARRLLAWLREMAAHDLAMASAQHAEALGVTPRRIGVREMRSRWGSCSARGDLSFNWRLILAPPFVLDYVAAHEVAHLRIRDHGPRFWSLVESRTPHMAKARSWLKCEGAGLFRYAPPLPGD